MTERAADKPARDPEWSNKFGSVQSLGALMVADKRSGKITHVSANLPEILSIPLSRLQGVCLEDVMSRHFVDTLRGKAVEIPGNRLVVPGSIVFTSAADAERDVHHLTYSQDANLIVELFPDPAMEMEVLPPSDAQHLIIDELRAHQSIGELSDAAVTQIRSQTGYERVLCYRIYPDGFGKIIAEDTSLNQKYLSLEYPPIDIPRSALELFSRNQLRYVADVDASPVPIIGLEGITDKPDLSNSKLRSVSPLHQGYMKAMAVASILALPLVVEGKLWGVLVCQHRKPKCLSPRSIHRAERTAQLVAVLLENIVRKGRDRTVSLAKERAATLSGPTNNEMSLLAVGEQLASWFDADAVGAQVDGSFVPLWHWSGEVADFGALHEECTDGTFVTDRLRDHLHLSGTLAQVYAGCAFISIDAGRDEYVVLLRKKMRQEIAWRSTKGPAVDLAAPKQKVPTPRAISAKWREMTEGRSRPFSANDELALGIILPALRALLSTRRADRLEPAIRDLKTGQSELSDRLLRAAQSASRGELAAAIAHELNQPLTSISNFISASRVLMRQQDRDDRKVASLMDSAIHETQRAGQIVVHLRNLMRPGVERKQHFDLRETLEEAVRLAVSSDMRADIDLNIDIPDVLPDVHGAKVQIGLVVFNLVRNAVEAMIGQPVGRLTIKAVVPDEAKIVVIVEDSGPGIAPAYRETLFQPFRTSKSDGMGIGLSLCRLIVQAHHGRIWGENTETGARFGFSLPSYPVEVTKDG